MSQGIFKEAAAPATPGTGFVTLYFKSDGKPYVKDDVGVESGVIISSDFSAAEGFLRKTGTGTYEAIKSNLSAAVAPGVNDDSASGYAIGSLWLDTTADNAYICLDATATSAVWKLMT